MENEEQKHSKRINLSRLTEHEEKLLQLFREERLRAKDKFPLAYALLATFGLVATVTGFNKLIDKTEFLKENPVILIFIGVGVLVITGAVYNKRSN